MAGILQAASFQADMECLTILIDTFTIHCSVFKWLEIHERLRQSLVERYRQLRLQFPPRRTTVASLLELTESSKSDKELFEWVKSDMGQCCQPLGIAANTPASEGVMCDLLGSQGDLDDDIERVLASGQSMSGETPAQILDRIETLLLASDSGLDARDIILRYGNLLNALHALDEDRLEKATMGMLQRLACSASYSPFTDIGPALVGLGCLRITSLVESVQRQSDHEAANEGRVCRLRLEVLELLSTPSSALVCEYKSVKQLSYAELGSRFETARYSLCKRNPMTIIQLVLHSLHALSNGKAKQADRIRKVCRSVVLSNVLRMGLNDSPFRLHELFRNHVDSLRGDEAKECFSTLTTKLMDPTGAFGKSKSILLINDLLIFEKTCSGKTWQTRLQ